MTFIQIAFKKYSIVKNVWDMPWADNLGFEYFIKAFSNRDFLYSLHNSILLNLLDMVVGFPTPIILALLLNELAFKGFKKVTQTISLYAALSIVDNNFGNGLQLLAPSTGMVNIVLNRIGFSSVPFLNEPVHWVITYVLLGVWQSIGWNTIIYLAAITAIDPEQYEGASIDGAGRFKKIWHVTLPGIRSTIVILLILRLGSILGSEFDKPYA